MNGIITSAGIYVPPKSIQNDYFYEKLKLDTSDEWIYSRTGIKSRYIADDESSADMAIKAASECSISDNIKLVIVATSTNPNSFPSVASRVHKSLNLPESVMSFDINDACNGFMQGLVVAMHLISGTQDEALVIGSEKMSSIVDWNDRATCVLFGDGAGAITIKHDSSKKFAFTHYTLSDYYESLYANRNIHMNGQEVFRSAVKSIAKDVQNLLTKTNLSANDIDLFIPHQANTRILDGVKNIVGFKDDVIVNIVANHGNTSAATIPMAIWSVRDRLLPGKKVILSGFGAGFSGGSVLLEI